ncbi:MAG: FAD-dependent oxidoreductase, partial [Polyangiaceae bacterium]|nr:FAD-dependent oxidoreductase [Polyangiaceae bacterium]
MDKKIRVYFCTGCGIGEALDISALEKTAKRESKGGDTKSHEMLCSPEGRSMLEKDIANDGVNTLLIAACSMRVHQDTFLFPAPTIVERVSLREHVAWMLKPGDEDTQMAADDYVKMGVVKVMKYKDLTPAEAPITHAVLVVGGGVTGLSAALETARAGVRVVLVEKGDALGGWVARFGKKFPTRPPYADLAANNIADVVEAVLTNPKITALTSASIESIAGQPG